MARRFNGNIANYFGAFTRAPVIALPITIAYWTKPNLTAIGLNSGVILALQAASGDGRIQVSAGTSTSASGPWYYRAISADNSNNSVIADSPSIPNNGMWSHGAGVFASTTSRVSYYNGIAGTEVTTSNDPSAASFTRSYIGVRRSTGLLQLPFIGDIADIAVWNIALTSTEIAILATGVSPLKIRTSNLVAYWPLNGRVGSGEASLFSELDYATRYGAVPVVDDPVKAFRNGAKPFDVAVHRPYPRIYYVAGPNATWATPTSTEIMAGQLSGGGAATASWSESAPLITTTPFNFSQPASPLTTGTKYRAAAVQKAADSNVVSNVVESDPFLAGAATLSNPEATDITNTTTKPKVTVSY